MFRVLVPKYDNPRSTVFYQGGKSNKQLFYETKARAECVKQEFRL